MVKKVGKHKRSKETANICYLDPALLLFYTHRLCMNYIIAMLLLVSCMSTHNHLLYFVQYCVGSTPRMADKNVQQRTLPGFITISIY